jgi:hypothetical protein
MVCWSCYASDSIAALPCQSGTFHASYPWCPWYAANGVLPIHIHGSRPTRLHHLLHIPLILVLTAQYIPLLAIDTVGPPVVCRQWYAAHPYSWLLAHPSTSSISYTTYPSAYYTIYTTIGYGRCQPAHGVPPIHGALGVPPIHHAHGMQPSIFMALGPPI